LKISDHKIGILVELNLLKRSFNSLSARAEGFCRIGILFYTCSSNWARTNNGITTGSRLLSQFGKFNMLFLTVSGFTIRRDGSSRFGQDNRYGIFPAVAVGWRINNEEFLKM
jgi:hypothetical protein